MKTILNVSGMTCGHCKAAVEGALNEVEGVDAVEANVNTGKVEVTHAESANKVEMREAIEEQGYDVEWPDE